MAPKSGDTSKKAQGQARKAAAAEGKKAEANARAEAAESKSWEKGSKDTSKADAAAEKAAEQARKKAEKAALAAEEDASLPSKGSAKGGAKKKSKGLDLSALEGMPGWNPAGKGAKDTKPGALNATGIDNALDALSLANTSGAGNDKVDRHPERRFKAAYAAFEERRLDEMKDEKGLRRQQKIDQIRKEFDKHPDNPFNQALVGRYDMSKDEMRDLREQEKDAKESRLTGP